MARDHQSWAARVKFQTTGPRSGITTNDFYFKYTGGIAPTPTEMSGLAGKVFKFFNGVSGGTSVILAYMGPQVYRATNSVEVDLYDLDLTDIHHHFGSPVSTYQFTPASFGGSTPIPNECSVVLSYRAGYASDPEHDGSTRPRASDRGRAYIGPLGDSALQAPVAPNGTKYSVIAAPLITIIVAAASTLNSDVPTHNFLWSVWSRKEQVLKPVAYKACDNSVDIQRRREVEPPSLQTWVTI